MRAAEIETGQLRVAGSETRARVRVLYMNVSYSPCTDLQTSGASRQAVGHLCILLTDVWLVHAWGEGGAPERGRGQGEGEGTGITISYNGRTYHHSVASYHGDCV